MLKKIVQRMWVVLIVSVFYVTANGKSSQMVLEYQNFDNCVLRAQWVGFQSKNQSIYGSGLVFKRSSLCNVLLAQVFFDSVARNEIDTIGRRIYTLRLIALGNRQRFCREYQRTNLHCLDGAIAEAYARKAFPLAKSLENQSSELDEKFSK